MLIYAIDRNSEKQPQAARVVTELARSGDGVISTQVLQEFYVNATRKLRIPPLEARSLVRDLRNFDVVTVSPEMVDHAIDTSVLNQTSFWDALILVAASQARCSVVLSEDLSHGSRLIGLRIVNPFRA